MQPRPLAVVVACLVPLSLLASELSEKASALAVGEWVELDTNWPSVIRDQDFVWSDSASWDSRNRQVNWICSPVGQAPYHHYRYDEASNRWSRVTTPHGVRSGHGYDVNTADYDGHIFYSQHGDRTVHRGTWNGSGYTWEDLPQVNIEPKVANSLSWVDFLDNGRGGLVFVTGDGVSSWYKFSAPSGWQPPLPRSTWGSPHPFSQYNPEHRVHWAGGGNGHPKTSKILNENLVWESKVDAPTGCDLRVSDSLKLYDPAGGKFLLYCQNDRWYEFDHRGAGRYTDITGSMQNRPSLAIFRGMAHAPIPQYGVVMVIQGQSSGSATNPRPGVWIYRHSPSGPNDPDPPPAPQNLVAQ